MQHIPIRRFQGVLACSAVLVMMLLITACAGVGGNPGQPTSSTTATATSSTQVSPTPTAQPTQPTPTPVPVAFKAGGISFIGPVKSISSSSLVMSAPNGQTYSMVI